MQYMTGALWFIYVCVCVCISKSNIIPLFIQSYSLVWWKMPNTRSQRQPTLQFPKRKSSRVSSQPKKSPQPDSEHVLDARTIPLSPRNTGLGVRNVPLSPAKTVADARIFPLSPRKTNVVDTRAIPLSPRHHVLQSIPPSERLPLSPRKRTGNQKQRQVYTFLSFRMSF